MDDWEADSAKDVSEPSERATGVNTTLADVLADLGVSEDRIHMRYSDVMVMCATHQEAFQIAKAGPWKSMAEIVRTNPGHPDAKQYPWLCDIPFANLAGYVASNARK